MRTPSSRRTGAACRMAGWCAGANRKPMPTRSITAATRPGGTLLVTPSASSTSALPQREETARLPCLATGMPAPAATRAAAVEMLKVPLPSPPVPQVSTRPWRARGRHARRARACAVAKPVISSTVSPLVRSAISTAASCVSVETSPAMMAPIRRRGLVAREIRRRRNSFSMVSRDHADRTGPPRARPPSRKFASSWRPPGSGSTRGGTARPRRASPSTHAHDLALRRVSGYLEEVGKTPLFGDQGVVAGGAEGIGEPVINGAAVVVDARYLAVHHVLRAPRCAAEDLDDALVAEADAEDGNRLGEVCG